MAVSDVSGASAAADAADLVILVVDNAKDGGGEGHDRKTISLASDQQVLARCVSHRQECLDPCCCNSV
jgi:hypothetical protein